MKFILLKNKDPFFNSFDIANPKLTMNKTTNKLSIDTNTKSIRMIPKGSFSIFQYRVNSSLPSNTSSTVGNPLLFLETEYNKFRGSLFNHSFIDKPRRLLKQDISFPEMRKLPILYKYIPDFFLD
jgi:cobalamin biosynthesis Co2+ chelatase CbiK